VHVRLPLTNAEYSMKVLIHLQVTVPSVRQDIFLNTDMTRCIPFINDFLSIALSPSSVIFSIIAAIVLLILVMEIMYY